MMHEKIIRRDDGSRVKITCDVRPRLFSGKGASYTTSVTKCEKGKRKFVPYNYNYDYVYRALSMSERREYANEIDLTMASIEEIYSTKLEAWEKLKPEVFS